MIELQDAIERAKLAADTGNMLASYTYDQISKQLDPKDLHAFTMSLLDLGIHAKYGSMDDESHMAHVLAMGNEVDEDTASNNRRMSIVEEFVQAAQGGKLDDTTGDDQMGNVSDKLKIAMLNVEAQLESFDEPDRPSVPEFGSITVEIGVDWIRNTFESMAPGEGDRIYMAFAELGGYDHEDALEGLVDVWKRDYGVGVPEAANSGEEVEVRIETVPSPSAEVGLELGVWEENSEDPDGNSDGGWSIGDIMYIQDTDKIQQDLREDLIHVVDMYQEGGY